MQRNRIALTPREELRALKAGTYEGLDPVGHAKDVGMPVIIGGSSGGHFSQIDSAEALCAKKSKLVRTGIQNWAVRGAGIYKNRSCLASKAGCP